MFVRIAPLISAAILAALAMRPAFAEQVDLQLVLAADTSDSIDDGEFRMQRAGYATAITDERVLTAIRTGPRQAIAIAFVEWGAPESQHTVVDWMVVRDTASAKAFADKLLAAPCVAIGYNSISNAIAYSADLIRNSGYTSPRKIIDVSGDGSQRNGQPLEKVRARTVADGITINALVVDAEGGWFPDLSRDALLEHFQRDVIGGGNAFAMVVNGKKRFADAVLNKMIREIALSTP